MKMSETLQGILIIKPIISEVLTSNDGEWSSVDVTASNGVLDAICFFLADDYFSFIKAGHLPIKLVLWRQKLVWAFGFFEETVVPVWINDAIVDAVLSDNVVKLNFRQLNYSIAKLLGKLTLNWENEFLDSQGAIFNFFVFVSRQELHYPALALRALGLILADGAPTVGGGKTFWAVSRIFLRKQL